MKIRIICMTLIAVLTISCIPVSAAGADFTDVPKENWAESSITQAVDLGIISGYGNGIFGFGDKVTRAQFAAMLVRLFKWEVLTPDTPAFSDNSDKSQWYYSQVETAAAHGAVLKDRSEFRPDADITREEMAVMLVNSLGYSALSADLSQSPSPFTDMSGNQSSIRIAYDFGIISGMTATTFDPNGSATREQAAAMMIRLHDRYSSKLQWLHGFYAISSYAQKDMIPQLNALSFGWSKLQYSEADGPVLNMTSSGNNEYSVPSGYAEVVMLAKMSNVPANLNIMMSTSQDVALSDGSGSNACREILLNASMRTKVITDIAGELTRGNNYSGVTVDFEGLKGAELKDGLSQFLLELRTEMDKLGMRIYVCVPPVTSDGIYYDGYDYEAIGQFADKVILMAHDYQATSLTDPLMSAGFTTTPLTPIYDVYHALEAITDPDTGVADHSKIALALSFGSVEWSLQNGKVINAQALRPTTSSLYERLINPSTTLNYPQRYQNPNMTFTNENDGTQNIIWYEDQRSVAAKVELARMFGINSISVWRLGLVPDFTDPIDRQIHYDVLNYLLEQKK